jgi:hypothetical protein
MSSKSAQTVKWDSMKSHKPIDPNQFNFIDYGYVVRVIKGENGYKGGLAVMFSRFGDIGVKTDFPEQPCFLNGYNFREQPSNLKVLSKFPLTRREWEAFQRKPALYGSINLQEDSKSIFTFGPARWDCNFFGAAMAFATMRGLNIKGADKQGYVYRGTVDCVDELEHCSFQEKWVAHPFQNVYQVNGRNYAFKVRPSEESNSPGNNFTLNSEFDDIIEHYVMHGILAFNPDLPVLGSEKSN